MSSTKKKQLQTYMESFLHLRKIQLKTVFKHLDYRSVLCIAINTRVTKQALKGRMKYYN